jgi:hypothetical protein
MTSHGHSHAAEFDSKLTWSCATTEDAEDRRSNPLSIVLGVHRVLGGEKSGVSQRSHLISEGDDGNTRGLTPRLFNPLACRDFVINRPDK